MSLGASEIGVPLKIMNLYMLLLVLISEIVIDNFR